MKALPYFFIFIIILISVTNCIEPFPIENQTYENALVIETIITNEQKHQEIKLSRVIRLIDSIDVYEKNAQVWIETNNQSTYQFTETENGVYVSDIEFKAVPGIAYKLFINTSDGKQYKSREEFLTPEAEISNLYAERAVVKDKLGIQIYVDSNEDIGDAKYFRYAFEETYKIKTPYDIIYNVDLENIITSPPNNFGFDIVISTNTEEKQICYKTDVQTEIIQTNIENTSINNITRFPVRFISQNNSIIRERYSILVKQYTQTLDSYNYYKILGKLGNVESLMIENQSGYINSNITALNDENEKIVGFFDVSCVSEKRLFFDYYDFDLNKPDYFYDCFCDTLFIIPTPPPNKLPTYVALLSKTYRYLEFETPPRELVDTLPNEYSVPQQFIPHPALVLAKPECSNCNTFGTNVKPDFWED